MKTHFPNARSKSQAIKLLLLAPLMLVLAGCFSVSSDDKPGKGKKQVASEQSSTTLSESESTTSSESQSTSTLEFGSYTPPAGSVDAKLQVGPWILAPFNPEEPFINIIHASSVNWANNEDGYTTERLYDEGYIDPDTGMLNAIPSDASRIYTTVYFSAADKRFYDGDWVLEWDGDADMEIEWLATELQERVSANRIEFTRDESSIYHSRILVTRVGAGGVTGLRMFRADYEDELDAGQIYAPGFIDNVSRGHVVRFMDMQEANRAYIHDVDQLATMSQHFWNNMGAHSGKFAQHKSMPVEAVVRLAAEGDVDVWHHAPMELGSPVDFLDPSVYSDSIGEWGGNVRAMIAAPGNAEAALASDQWDQYADRLVAALQSEGYPQGRPFYTTISNEVWNFSGHYYVTTNYAWGFGEGYGGGDWHYRHGYGVLMARWMLALEAALARAGRSQNVIYVVEGQAANVASTYEALAGMKQYVEDSGKTWTQYSDKVGVSVASYWGSAAWYNIFSDVASSDLAALHERFANEAQSNPASLAKRVADYLIEGPNDVIGTRQWVLKKFSEHADTSGDFGVEFFGAYEGGSHDDAPEFFRDAYGADSEALYDWYEYYHWGVEGARVNNAVNDAIAEAYPGFVLSNYVTYGQAGGVNGGQPWFDGMPGDNLPMQISWEKYYRP